MGNVILVKHLTIKEDLLSIKHYVIARTTVTTINLGQNHYNKELNYPLRKSRRGLKG